MGKFSQYGFVESTTVIVGVLLFSLLAFGGALTINNRCEIAKALDEASGSTTQSFTKQFCLNTTETLVGNLESVGASDVTTETRGERGEKGDKGDKGDTGAIGATGATGATGQAGAKGDKGDVGATGATGATGPAGPTGIPGTSGSAGGWGDITGTLADQTDLQSALDDKQDLLLSNNISQWTNDALYITDGNTNWDNSYGFITDGNTGWDNSYGLITASDTVTGLVQSTIAGNSYFTGGNLGIGTTEPSFKLELAGTSSTSDRKIGINGTQVLYLPDQTSFTGSLVLGNGGNNLTNTIDTNGYYNTLIGIGAGTALTTGQSNTAIGYQALTSANNDSWNTAVGRYALTALTTGVNNVAIGNDAGRYLVSGGTNIFIGDSSGNSTMTGSDDNIFIGYQTGWSANNAFGNVVLGNYAFEGANGSSENTMIGNAAGADSTGSYNTMIGPLAGRYTTGNNNIFLGYRAGENVYAGSNNLIIGHDINASSATSSNQLIIGNLIFGTGIDGTGNTLSSGNIGIGTTSPEYKLDVNGTTASTLFLSNNDGFEISSGAGGQARLGAGTSSNFIGSTSNNAFSIRTNNSDVMYLTSGGNVGIGTTAPGSRLHVVGGTAGTIAMEVRGNSSNNANIQEWKHNDGTLLTAISNEGFLDLSSSGLPNTFNLALKVNNAIVGASEVAGGFGNGIIRVSPTGRSLFNFITNDSVNSLFSGGVDGEGYRRFAIAGSGLWQVGSGSANVDTFLARLSSGGFEVSTTTAAATSLTVQQIFNQTGDYLNLTSVGGAAGDIFTVNSSGNVGVGTTNPQYKLDVMAGARIQAGSASTSQNFDGVTFPPTGWTTGGDVSFTRDTGTTKGSSAGSANTGAISDNQSTYLDYDVTTTEESTLSFYWKVSSEANYDYLFFCLDNDACTSASGYTARISGTVDWTEYTVNLAPGSHSLRWIYSKDNSAASGTDEGWIEDVVISPSAALAFTQGGTSGYLRYSNGSFSLSKSSTANDILALKGNVGQTGNYLSVTSSTGTLGDVLAISGTNNVGIGDSTPSSGRLTVSDSGMTGNYVLEVHTDDSTPWSAGFYNDSYSTSTPVFEYYGENDGTFHMGTNASEDLRFYTGGYANPKMSIAAAGNVGIGTTDPQQALHVYRGSDGAPVRFEDTNGYCEINPTSTTWTCTSDMSLKKDITVINNEDALERIKKLESVTFRWNKQDSTDQKSYGLIAQDVEKIFPEFVTTSESGLKSVSYGSFTPVLISAINAQGIEIEALQKVADKIVLSANDEGPLTFLSPINSPELVADSVKTKSLTVDGITFASEADIATIQASLDGLAERLDTLESTINDHANVLAAMSANNQDIEILLNNELIKSLIAGGSIKITGDAEFEGATYFKNIAAFFDTVIFAGKPLYEDTDLAGYAEIPAGETNVQIVFDKPFRNTPVINLTPRDFIQNLVYRVHSESETGFTIAIDQPTFESVRFSWTAFPIKYIKNSVSSPTPTATFTPTPTSIPVVELTPTMAPQAEISGTVTPTITVSVPAPENTPLPTSTIVQPIPTSTILPN